MALEEPLRRVGQARADLIRAGHESDGWRDSQRGELETDRLIPLQEAARRIVTALERAQQACVQAARLQAD